MITLSKNETNNVLIYRNIFDAEAGAIHSVQLVDFMSNAVIDLPFTVVEFFNSFLLQVTVPPVDASNHYLELYDEIGSLLYYEAAFVKQDIL
jgi:hypothetical protein